MTHTIGMRSDDELLPLLGAALIAVQKIDFLLYRSIRPLCQSQPIDELKKLSAMPAERFLYGTLTELKPTLLMLHEQLGEQLPLPVNELLDFIYQRNLITRQYWQVTEAEIKGGEKIANPKQYLTNLLDNCENWCAQIEMHTKHKVIC